MQSRGLRRAPGIENLMHLKQLFFDTLYDFLVTTIKIRRRKEEKEGGCNGIKMLTIE